MAQYDTSSVLKRAIRVYFNKIDCYCGLNTDPQFGCGVEPHYIHWESVAPLDRLEIVDMSSGQYTRGAFYSLAQCARHVKMILTRDHKPRQGRNVGTT